MCSFAATELRGAGTPGLPMCQAYATNKAALEAPDVIDEAVTRLWQTLSVSTVKGTHPRGWDAVRLGVVDPVIPFAKNEVMPRRKMGTLRLVSGLSIVDQIVERVLIGNFVSEVKHQYPESSVLVGIGFSDELATQFANKLETRRHPDSFLTGADLGSFDSSQKEVHVQSAYSDGIAGGIEQPDYTILQAAISYLGELRSLPVYAIRQSDGWHFYEPFQAGNMLSGCLATTTVNGMIRVELERRTGALEADAAGDDGLAERLSVDVDRITQAFTDQGFRLRDFNVWSRPGEELTQFEFCSHVFFKTVVQRGDRLEVVWKCYLKNADRALYKLLSRKVTPIQLEDYHREILHHPEYDRLMGCARRHVEFQGGPEPTAERTEKREE